MRTHPDLPAISPDCGFVANDCDVIIHRYLTCYDGIGSREIQAMMDIETKTRGAFPSRGQLDTLYKRDLFKGKKITNDQYIRFFGVFVLVMSGTSPDDSIWMKWRRFRDRKLQVHAINMAQLIQLLRFEIDPRNFVRQPFRRHHKTRSWMERIKVPLGFEVEMEFIKRS